MLRPNATTSSALFKSRKKTKRLSARLRLKRRLHLFVIVRKSKSRWSRTRRRATRTSSTTWRRAASCVPKSRITVARLSAYRARR